MIQTIEINKKEYAVIPKKMLEKKMQQIEDMEDTIAALKYEQKKNKQFVASSDLKKSLDKKLRLIEDLEDRISILEAMKKGGAFKDFEEVMKDIEKNRK